MGRSRKPTALLELSGAFKHDPQRRVARTGEPAPNGPVGKPPAGLSTAARRIWRQIVQQAAPGVLGLSDTLAVEAASILGAKVRAGKATAAESKEYRAWLSSLGMTATSKSAVKGKTDEKENEFASI